MLRRAPRSPRAAGGAPSRAAAEEPLARRARPLQRRRTSSPSSTARRRCAASSPATCTRPPTSSRNGVRYLTTPSTCFQFLPAVDNFAVDTRPPGFRWLDLVPDGSHRDRGRLGRRRSEHAATCRISRPPRNACAAVPAVLAGATPDALPMWEVTGTRQSRAYSRLHPLPAAGRTRCRPRVVAAYDDADVVVMEIDLDDSIRWRQQATMQRLAIDPTGPHAGRPARRRATTRRPCAEGAGARASTWRCCARSSPGWRPSPSRQLQLAQLGFDAESGVEQQLLAARAPRPQGSAGARDARAAAVGHGRTAAGRPARVPDADARRSRPP